MHESSTYSHISFKSLALQTRFDEFLKSQISEGLAVWHPSLQGGVTVSPQTVFLQGKRTSICESQSRRYQLSRPRARHLEG